MSSSDEVVEKIAINMKSTRSDIKSHLGKINPLLKEVLDILADYPEMSADDDTEVPAGFSKVLYSRVTS
jgi:hypothetical protein